MQLFRCCIFPFHADIFSGYRCRLQESAAFPDPSDIRAAAGILGVFKSGSRLTWFAFPVAEYTAGTLGVILYFLELKKWKNKTYINPALLSRI